MPGYYRIRQDICQAGRCEGYPERRWPVTVHVPLSRQVFSRRMRQNPEGNECETA